MTNKQALEIILNSLCNSFKEEKKIELSQEELDILTFSMEFDILKKNREPDVKSKMVELDLTSYPEQDIRWERHLYSAMTKAIKRPFAYFEDKKKKVQFGGYAIGDSLMVIMEQESNDESKRMYYHIFPKNPLSEVYTKEFWEKEIKK